MENPAEKIHRCIHQMIRWSLKMIYLDVFDKQFRYSLGYCFVFGSHLTAIIGCGCSILTSEGLQPQLFAAACAMAFFQVIVSYLYKKEINSPQLTEVCKPIHFPDILQILFR